MRLRLKCDLNVVEERYPVIPLAFKPSPPMPLISVSYEASRKTQPVMFQYTMYSM